MEPSTNAIGKRIKELRKRYNLNQKDFAKPLGISNGHISNIEKGNDMPSAALIKLIAREYNTSEDWIITGAGSQMTHKPIDNAPSNMEHSSELMLDLDEMLCKVPSSVREQEEKVLETLILLFQEFLSLESNERDANFKILDNMLFNLYNFSTSLRIAKTDDTDPVFSRDRILDRLQDTLFEEFVEHIHNYRENYDIL